MSLNVARKADREIMAQRLNKLVLDAGFATWPEDPALLGPREFMLHIAADDLRLSVDFDGDSRQQREGVWVLAWHIASNSDAKMTEAFASAAGADVNPFHRRKCTSVAYGFEALLAQVAAVLELVREGKALS